MSKMRCETIDEIFGGKREHPVKMSNMRCETIDEIFGGQQPVREKKKIYVKIPEHFEMIQELAVIKHREYIRKKAEKIRKKQEYEKRLFAKF